MARTNRDKLNHRRRENVRSWEFYDLLPGFDFDYSDPINRYPRLRGGNMVMSQSASGIWDDERAQKGRDRDAQRRNQKRSERQRWRKEVESE